MADDLEEVRKVLFDTLRQVSAKDKPMDIDRAKAICGVAQTIINSASVEVRAMNAAAISESGGFFKSKALPASPAVRATGMPAQLPPGRVVDPLAQVKPGPPDPEEITRSRTVNGRAR